MRIIRFVDDGGNLRYGDGFSGGRTNLLAGEPLAGLRPAGRTAVVKKLLVPLQPSAILCIGLNYRRHANEFGAEPPARPVLFMKNPAAVTHPDSPIVIPAVCPEPEVDFEIELAVVIGRPARNVSPEEALDYVFGYTVANDVSARRWQKEAGGGQWVRSKSFDTFCPLGPAVVTADEIEDPQNLELVCSLNGEIMQQGTTRDMIFTVAKLISYLSEDTTLLPGTVILTGTPHGVGFARTPPVFLKPGDRLEMCIEPIGTLCNTVAAAR